MTSLRFLDTNILLYSISRDPTETTKHDRAVALIAVCSNALSVRVLQEFYVQATPDALEIRAQAILLGRRHRRRRPCARNCIPKT